MDVHEVLSRKIKELPVGLHADGLRAVISHIEAAVRHFTRGQNEPDETLFTDVIFRCNQAFEGSIKEAYRVLAAKDPQSVKPYEIEQFLASGNLLRKKVLDQFTNYRREWRNPSAHDYTLDFDEDEALIAIVSVTVFAIVLIDQIDGKLAFDAAASVTPAQRLSRSEQNAPLLDLVTSQIHAFAQTHVDGGDLARSQMHDYYRLEGALAGYLTAELSIISKLTVEQNKRLESREADIVVSRGAEKIIIELRRISTRSSAKMAAHRAVTQVALYLHEPAVVGAVVLVYSPACREYGVERATGALAELVRTVAPIS